MAQLTIDVDEGLMADMAALALAERREAVEIVHTALTQYLHEHGAVRSPKSVKVSGLGNSVSVAAVPRVPASLAERKRLGERTGGIWKDRDVDGLQYQLAQRSEW
jgi:Arc/MetJ family transcription regulator